MYSWPSSERAHVTSRSKLAICKHKQGVSSCHQKGVLLSLRVTWCIQVVIGMLLQQVVTLAGHCTGTLARPQELGYVCFGVRIQAAAVGTSVSTLLSQGYNVLFDVLNANIHPCRVCL